MIGSGSFGSALAVAFARADNNNEVYLYGRDKQVIAEINNTRYNSRYLPEIVIDETICVTTDMEQALGDAKIIVLATPAKTYDEMSSLLVKYIADKSDTTIVITAKGFGEDLFLSNIINKSFSHVKIAALSGPNFARDIAKGIPAATTIASCDMNDSSNLAKKLVSNRLRFYPSDDLKGVLLCGGLKNIYAIGGGIVHGLGFGPSTQSFYLSRVLTEMGRIIRYFKGQEKTLLSPAGVGDLAMCCQNRESRNMEFGWQIASNGIDSALNWSGNRVVEGFNSLKLVFPKFKELDCPIIHGLQSDCHC